VDFHHQFFVSHFLLYDIDDFVAKRFGERLWRGHDNHHIRVIVE